MGVFQLAQTLILAVVCAAVFAACLERIAPKQGMM